MSFCIVLLRSISIFCIGALAAIFSLYSSQDSHAAIVTTGNLTGTGTPYNGVDDPWMNIDFKVGNSAPGSMAIDGGSVVISNYTSQTVFTRIADSALANDSLVSVTGTGSEWKVSGFLDVGSNGNGTLNISNGGKVSAFVFIAGGFDRGLGTVNVGGGVGTSTLRSTNGMNIGSFTSGILNVSKGGAILNDNEAHIGSFARSVGKATVDGTNGSATWTSTGSIIVGNSGNGELNIVNGGFVTSASGAIADDTTGVGTVNVGGASGISTWQVNGNLTIGTVSGPFGTEDPGGTGVLNINSNGLVVANRVQGNDSALSQINFNAGTLRLLQSTTNYTRYNLLTEGGTIETPVSGTQITIPTTINGIGTFNKSGVGSLVLTAANPYTGNTIINGGSLKLSGSGSIANSPRITLKSGASLDATGLTGGANFSSGRFSLSSGQTLEGNGTVIGAVGIRAGSAIAPGESIGSMNTGSLFFTNTSSVLNSEIDFLGASSADLVSVSGAVSLSSSTLDLDFFNPESFTNPKTFLIVLNDSTDPITGTFGSLLGPAGMIASVNYAFNGTDSLGRVGNGNDIAVTITAVPEPSSLTTLITIATLTVVSFRKRRPCS